MKFLLAVLIGFCSLQSFGQKENPGVIEGNVLDEKSKALQSATVQLTSLNDSNSKKITLTDKDGAFQISEIPFGYYSLKISYVGFTALTLDSINFRAGRFDFNLNDVVLKSKTNQKMDEVIIYSEKPLIQSKDGNITFNAGESPLSAGSNASELLSNVPLVTKDPDGNILVRGKQPKILIDDKPVDLSLQQLQDLLEAMPGSSIEKIEVLTNPPPEYANEPGGVINIVTKKGTIGINGRFSVYGGTRGEAGSNASFNYRKQGFTLNVNAGTGYNYYEGNGYSKRENIYADSVNYFNTNSNYQNKNIRPNFRTNVTYDLNKFNSLNLVLQYNQNDFNNLSHTEYQNLNQFDTLYNVSRRTIKSIGNSYNPNISFSYTLKTRKPGEMFRLISNYNQSSSGNTRNFYQQYFNPDYTPTGKDSTQQQITNNQSKGYSVRLSYDLPVNNQKTFFSVGSFYIASQSNIVANASYKRSSDNQWLPLDVLSNNFRFQQFITNVRAAVKQMISENFSTTVGVSAEQTKIYFDLYKTNSDTANFYWNYLPFATINKTWNDIYNLSLSYRKTIRRPGINELNPTIDFSDPYNIRFGNPGLVASPSHNFSLVSGRAKNSSYSNIALGYNIVENIYSQVRTLLPDGKTQITWQNISGRKEYEVSSWNGLTLNKHTKVNVSATYIYSTYSDFDREVRGYRNGGTFTSNVNTNYNWNNLYIATGTFIYNRYANPQGTTVGTLSMNIGLQGKFFKKKFIATLNIVDPFIQQHTHSFTYGTNFNLESYSTTQTKNYRLTLAYNFNRTQHKKTAEAKQFVQKVTGVSE